jgi:putative sugar O-methyltransferase
MNTEKKTGVKAGKRAMESLRQMLEDMERQELLFRPTEFWREASERIVRELEDGGVENFRRLAGPRGFFVPSYGPPGNGLSEEEVGQLEEVILRGAERGSKKHRTLLEALDGTAWAVADYRVFLAGDCPEIGPDLSRVTESRGGNPPDGLEIEGRRLSRSMLNYLHGLVFLKQQLGMGGMEQIRTVLEIGGGYGTLGEILHQCGPEYAYLDVDIPPTGAVALYYLAQLEGIKLHDYGATRELPEVPVPKPGHQMVLCPWQLPKVRGMVDLLWNFISFQEMEPEVVQFYLAEGRRLGAKYVLLRNLREGKQKKRPGSKAGVETPVFGQDYDRFLPDYRLIATNVFPFGYRTVDGFHSELRLYTLK